MIELARPGLLAWACAENTQSAFPSFRTRGPFRAIPAIGSTECGPPSHRPTATGVLGIKVHQIDNFALAPLYVYLFYQDVPVIASDESRK